MVRVEISLVCLAALVLASRIFAEEPAVVAVHERGVTAIAFSPDGKRLASADRGGLVVITDLSTHKRDSVLKHSVMKDGEESAQSVYSLAFSPDGKVLVTGSTDWVKAPKLGMMPVGAVRLWNVADGRVVGTLRGDVLTNPVTALAFSPDGQSLAAGGPSPGLVRLKGKEADQGEVRIWECGTLKLKATVRSRIDRVYTAQFSPAGNVLAFGSGDGAYGDDDPAMRRGEMVLWNVAKGREIDKLEWRGAGVFALAFAPKGPVMAVGGGVPPLGIIPRHAPVGRLVLWDSASKKEIAELKGHRYLVSSVAFSPDGKLLAAGGGDTNEKDDAVELKVWDVTTRREVADLSAKLKPMVVSVAFSPDGKSLAAASDNTILLWDVLRLTKSDPRK